MAIYTKFEEQNANKLIGKEILGDGDKRKVVAFKLTDFDVVRNPDTNFDEKSDRILGEEKKNLDEKTVLYEWFGEDNDFCKIEDIKNQG